MSNNYDIDQGGRSVVLLASTTITTAVTAVTTTPITGLFAPTYAGLQAKFVYGSGGTDAQFWIQTSFDQGVTWCDVMNFAFTTASARKVGAITTVNVTPVAPTDGTLASNTITNGLLGPQFRVKYTTTGTYAGGTTIYISGILK
jgi:hypothetical protein